MRQKRDSSSESYGLSCFFALHIEKVSMARLLTAVNIFVYRFRSSVYDRKSVKKL